MTRKIKALIFDWGDTLMLDFPNQEGPMAYWPKVEAVAGINKALEWAFPNYICCVASNAGESTSELMEDALNRVDVGQYFHHLFTSREIGFKKPSLEFFKNILKSLNLSPWECIMIGNNYEKDIVPAKTVGINTILFTENQKHTDFEDADYIVHSMNKLYEAIMEFEERKTYIG